MTYVEYAPPTGDAIELLSAPRLASWDKKDHPSQLALTAYLGQVKQLLRPMLDASPPNALAMELVIGLDEGLDLVRGGRDLDNYLYPVVAALGADRFASVRGEKHHGTR